jgi:hypothetical protein
MIKNDKFFVFDDVLDLPEHQNLFNYLKTLRWTSEWSSSTHTGGLNREDPIWHWNYSFFQVRGGMPAITPEEYQKLSVDHPAVIALWEKVSEIIKQHLGKFNILRLYSNCNPYGNSGYPHIDDGDYTMVYYPCVKWDSTWEGGTCFYEGTQDKENEYDAIRYVSYKPNRLIIFPAHVPHRGMPVDRRCYVPRYVIAMKLQRDVNDPEYMKQYYNKG